MKIKITFKDPNGVSDSIERAAIESVEEISGISADEREDLKNTRREEIEDSIKAFVEYSEYVTIEIDTETNTATVLKV
jgi:hypothetical protein